MLEETFYREGFRLRDDRRLEVGLGVLYLTLIFGSAAGGDGRFEHGCCEKLCVSVCA